MIAARYRTLVMIAGFASVGTALLLIVMKLVVWLFSGSTTILASLTDSVIDLGASFINLLALRFALTPADKDHRFGHYKAEALASLSQAAFICGSALVLIINGYDRLVKPVPISYIDIAIYVSIASIILTIGLTVLQGKVCKLTGSEAVAADRFHYLSDVGLNASVILSLILSKMGYDWADGLITIFLGLYIMKSAFHIGHVAISTLLDRSMSPDDNSKIIRAILSVPGLKSFHDLRTRQAGPQHYIQCHIVLDEPMLRLRSVSISLMPISPCIWSLIPPAPMRTSPLWMPNIVRLARSSTRKRSRRSRRRQRLPLVTPVRLIWRTQKR